MNSCVIPREWRPATDVEIEQLTALAKRAHPSREVSIATLQRLLARIRMLSEERAR